MKPVCCGDIIVLLSKQMCRQRPFFDILCLGVVIPYALRCFFFLSPSLLDDFDVIKKSTDW